MMSAPSPGLVGAYSLIDDVDTSVLTSRTGAMLSSADISKLLGQTRKTVNEMAKGGRVLRMRFGHRWRFPQIQFLQHEVLPGMAMVLASMGDIDPWRKLQILFSPTGSEDWCPIDLLLCGDKVQALAVASRAAAEVLFGAGP